LLLGGAIAPFGRAALAKMAAVESASLASLAEAVLPAEIGAEARGRAVDGFLGWLRDYRPGAQMEHGYGITRLWQAPASPASRYLRHFDDLDRRTGKPFARTGLEERRRAVIAALDAAGIRELPERPDGGHVASDLMAHYFNGPEANDLAYRRAIGRFSCRGLGGSSEAPPALATPESTT
jgi:hypothetical protein